MLCFWEAFFSECDLFLLGYLASTVRIVLITSVNYIISVVELHNFFSRIPHSDFMESLKTSQFLPPQVAPFDDSASPTSKGPGSFLSPPSPFFAPSTDDSFSSSGDKGGGEAPVSSSSPANVNPVLPNTSSPPPTPTTTPVSSTIRSAAVSTPSPASLEQHDKPEGQPKASLKQHSRRRPSWPLSLTTAVGDPRAPLGNGGDGALSQNVNEELAIAHTGGEEERVVNKLQGGALSTANPKLESPWWKIPLPKPLGVSDSDWQGRIFQTKLIGCMTLYSRGLPDQIDWLHEGDELQNCLNLMASEVTICDQWAGATQNDCRRAQIHDGFRHLLSWVWTKEGKISKSFLNPLKEGAQFSLVPRKGVPTVQAADGRLCAEGEGEDFDFQHQTIEKEEPRGLSQSFSG